ncbi:MAG: tetratricopeptide repeat protein [Filomicrobium sp.]
MAKISVDRAMARAKSHERKGEINEAATLYKGVLEAFPNNKRAQQALAKLAQLRQATQAALNPPKEHINALVSLYNQGQFAAVAEKSGQLTIQFPGSFVLWNLLGAAHKGLGYLEHAAKGFSRACEISPEFADAHNNLGVTLKELGRFDAAIASYRTALQIKPDYPEALNNLGHVLKELDQLDEAIALCRKAVELRPNYIEALITLGNALKENGELDAALDTYQKIIKIDPGHAKAHNNIGATLEKQGKYDEAIAAYEKAIELKPDYVEVYSNILATLQHSGKIDEAISWYQKALAIAPDHGEWYRLLSMLKKWKPDDPLIAQIENQYARIDLAEEDRCHICFALYTIYNGIGNYEGAFDRLSEGNKLRKKLTNYHISQDEKLFQRLKNTAPLLQDAALKPADSLQTPTPMFIVGMPRSGTTLVEQVTSAHSDVFGAGELRFVEKYGRNIAIAEQEPTAEELINFRNQYLEAAANHSDGSKFVIDKMPHNFRFVALICAAMPEAKIIHVHRDPSATCWSNFERYFPARGLEYCYDLADVAAYFRMYVDLMGFWSEQYGGRIHHLSYERLTTDQETETRRLIDGLGLDWQDACLSPHENTRAVQTASFAQVRKPVYKGSSQKWMKYAEFLNGVFDGLPEFE